MSKAVGEVSLSLGEIKKREGTSGGLGTSTGKVRVSGSFHPPEKEASILQVGEPCGGSAAPGPIPAAGP